MYIIFLYISISLKSVSIPFSFFLTSRSPDFSFSSLNFPFSNNIQKKKKTTEKKARPSKRKRERDKKRENIGGERKRARNYPLSTLFAYISTPPKYQPIPMYILEKVRSAERFSVSRYMQMKHMLSRVGPT